MSLVILVIGLTSLYSSFSFKFVPAFAAGDVDLALSLRHAQFLPALGAGKHLMRTGALHVLEEARKPRFNLLPERHEFIVFRAPFHDVFGKHPEKGVGDQKERRDKAVRDKVHNTGQYQHGQRNMIGAVPSVE
jgi:hypothetical protein